MKMRHKVGTVVAAVGVLGVVAASPASATTLGGAGFNKTDVSSAGGTVSGLCTFVTSIPSQSFNDIQFVLKLEIVADAPAYAVNGICTIKDMYGASYGSLVAGAPGSYATNAGTFSVNKDIKGAKVCTTPEALWLDGTEANPRNLSTCTPL